MTAAPVNPPVRQAPGVVKVRLAGSLSDLAMLTAILDGLAAVEILTGPDSPYPNHRDAGERVYLTVRIRIPYAAQQRGARAQPPSNPPAPLSLKGGTFHDDA